MKCPVCEHEAPVSDFGDPLRCPDCGAFYEKALLAKGKSLASAKIPLPAVEVSRPSIAAVPNKKEKQKTWVWVIAAVVVVIGFKGLTHDRNSPPAPIADVPVKPVEPPKAVPIPSSAFTEYNEADFPTLYSSWGYSGVERIMAVERKAAAHVSLAPDCSRVETAQIATMRSHPPRDIEVFVDCSNGNRFYVGDRELDRPPSSLRFKKVF